MKLFVAFASLMNLIIIGLFVVVSTTTVVEAAFNLTPQQRQQQLRLQSNVDISRRSNNNNNNRRHNNNNRSKLCMSSSSVNNNNNIDNNKPNRYHFGHLSNNNGINIFQNNKNNKKNVLSSFIAAAVVSLSVVVAGGSSAPQPANALELSKGAIVIQTTSTTGTTTTATKQANTATSIVDAQRLLKTLLTQRKDLAASINRIQSTISKELTETEAWKELYKEIMDVEEDVVPSIQIQQPQDITQTLKDIQKGKLNLLVNGEIINIVIEPNLSKEEDDLIIRITGFKGENFANPNPPTQLTENIFERKGPIRQKLYEISQFWDSKADYLPSSIIPITTTNGNVILTSSVGSIVAIYIASYAYYLDLQEQEAKAADDKKKAIAEKKKKRKAADKAEEAPKEKKEQQENNIKKVDDDDEKQVSTEQEKKDNDDDTDDDDDNDGKKTNTEEERRYRFRFWKNK